MDVLLALDPFCSVGCGMFAAKSGYILLFGICSRGLLLALDPFGPTPCEIFSFKSFKSLIV